MNNGDRFGGAGPFEGPGAQRAGRAASRAAGALGRLALHGNLAGLGLFGLR
jgi:hypothetical protein